VSGPATSSAFKKTLEDANIKLDSVVTDILGLSGRRILEELVKGQTVPQALASLAHRNLKASSEQLEASLCDRVTRHHRLLLKLHVDQIDAFDAAIRAFSEKCELYDCTVGFGSRLVAPKWGP
jgi:hypothetical protein